MNVDVDGISEATGVRVFSVSKQVDREDLGDRITRWMRETGVQLVRSVVTQSSDNSYHCLSITVFYRDREGA
jgi:hypothetical protein